MDEYSRRLNAINLTRSGIVICGVLGIVTTSFMLLPAFGEQFARIIWNYNEGLLPPLIGMVAAPVVTLATSIYLIRNSDEISQRIFPQEVSAVDNIEYAMYRVVFTGVGVFVLAGVIPQFVRALGVTVYEAYTFRNIEFVYYPDDSLTFFNAPYMIAFFFQVGIAIYLIRGAPHLIRWQIARSNVKSG